MWRSFAGYAVNVRRSSVERYLPVTYLALSIALVAFLLPSALRPPPDAPPTSAQLSPDAPPDDQVLITDLQGGVSQTAGAGTDVEVVDEQVVEALDPVVQPPRRGRCFGNPPRQTESYYSAACAPAWVGDNLGATTKGVSGNEIFIAAVIGESDANYEGPLREEGHSQERAVERHLRTWQTYFNERYEMYDRQIRIVLVKISVAHDAPTARSRVVGANQQWPLFGIFGITTQWPAIEESVRNEIIVMDGARTNSHATYRRFHPYFFSFLMDADKITRMHTEIVCKQLAGKAPEFNEQRDPTFDYEAPRKFGLMLYHDELYTGIEEDYRAGLAKCGTPIEVVTRHNIYDNQEAIAGAVVRMRAEGVTTIIVRSDFVSVIAFTNEAQNQAYFPEWWSTGTGGMQDNSAGRLYHQEQWRHALGAHFTEIPRPSTHTDCWQAYRSVTQDRDPDECAAFRLMQMFANGIQGAGPKLTPETFFQGLKSVPCRTPEPKWSIGGCFGDDNFTYAEYQALVWWDPRGADPNSRVPGAYQYMLGGQRFAEGEFPTEPLAWFEDGVTTPDDPRQPD